MLRLARAHPGRTAASVAVTLMMAVIVGNATLMQHGRHPAPLFAGNADQVPSEPAPGPLPPRSAVAPPRPTAIAPEEPPRRRERTAVIAASDDTPTGVAARGPDPDVLRAQHALVKLGFDIKPDGHLGSATRKALDSFAGTHHMLPMSGTLSPKLLQAVTAAASKPQG